MGRDDVSVAAGDPQATGDEELVRALYREHAEPLLGFVVHLTGDRQRAEDVVQETLLRAWRHPDAFQPGRGSARAWLFTVARNLVVDGQRARAARPREVSDEVLSHAPAAEESVEETVERAVLGLEVSEALWSLSQPHRDVLVETYYRGHTVAEAAVALRVPAGTVKSRTFYALRQLKLALEERGVRGR